MNCDVNGCNNEAICRATFPNDLRKERLLCKDHLEHEELLPISKTTAKIYKDFAKTIEYFAEVPA